LNKNRGGQFGAVIFVKEYDMKKRMLRLFVFGAAFVLLVLAGCDNPVDGNDDWLAEEANPFIGTWKTESTNMMNVKTTTLREFKTDGTIAITTTQGENEPALSTSYYLIKDNILVVSSSSAPFYTKYLFEVIDNNSLKIAQDGRSVTTYTREGDENPDSDRTIALSNGLEGFWRRNNLNFGSTEAGNFMYDWHTFRKDGTYHVYHYMSKNKHYVDRGDFSYFIDGDNRLVSLSNGYTVTVYHDFTKNGDNAFSWKTSADGEVLGFEKFNGETFWHAAE
jgi:hypothetical protein